MQRPEDDDHRQRGAVRVGDDALGAVAGRGGVDLRHDQRDLGVHAEGPGVVDDDRPLGGGDRRPLGGHLVGHVEHRDVDAVEGFRGERDDLDLRAADDELAARRARGGDQADLAPHVLAGREQVEHDGADRAGGADDGEGGLATGAPP